MSGEPVYSLDVPPMVYLAGPVRAESEWERRCNVFRAQETALRLYTRCPRVVIWSPHAELAPFTGELTEELIMSVCYAVIDRSQMLFTLPRWEHSEGTMKEIHYARDIGVPVFHDWLMLLDFLRSYNAVKEI